MWLSKESIEDTKCLGVYNKFTKIMVSIHKDVFNYLKLNQEKNDFSRFYCMNVLESVLIND